MSEDANEMIKLMMEPLFEAKRKSLVQGLIKKFNNLELGMDLE